MAMIRVAPPLPPLPVAGALRFGVPPALPPLAGRGGVVEVFAPARGGDALCPVGALDPLDTLLDALLPAEGDDDFAALEAAGLPVDACVSALPEPLLGCAGFEVFEVFGSVAFGSVAGAEALPDAGLAPLDALACSDFAADAVVLSFEASLPDAASLRFCSLMWWRTPPKPIAAIVGCLSRPAQARL